LLPASLVPLLGSTPIESALPETPVEVWHWVLFGVFVTVMLVLDLTVFHRKSHEPTLRESAAWTGFWCMLALGFNGTIWYWLGTQQAGAFLLGYVVEWSLSMDNVFVFLVVFTYFGVPLKYQYRVLFWGILGAVVMRLTFVTVAAALIEHFEWIMWIFGLFLVYTAIKLVSHGDMEVEPDKNPLLKIVRRMFPVTKEMHGEHFFVRESGRLMITPLFLVLIVIESTDVMFAVDSVPAIFGAVQGWITITDPSFTFIVFTSNIFAILGLRALYFLLAGVMDMFRYLNYGLSAVLGFVGLKMIVDYWAPQVMHALPKMLGMEENEKIVIGFASLVIIFSLLGTSIVASLIAERRDRRREAKTAAEAEK